MLIGAREKRDKNPGALQSKNLVEGREEQWFDGKNDDHIY